MSEFKKIRARYEDAKSKLVEEFGYKNVHSIPVVEKVVINMGTQDELRNKEKKERLISDMAIIAGQKPKIQRARLSVAGFGIREGMPVGLTSTLRRGRMYAFLEKLIAVTLPRLRDFRGVSRGSFDQHGNYTLGIKDYTVFPEIDLTKIDKPRGLEITIVTSAKTREEAEKLLELLGMPFQKQES